MDFSCTLLPIGPDVLVQVGGNVDILTSMRLRDTLEAAIEQTTRDVRMDLSQVTFMGNTGLMVLNQAARELFHRQGRLHMHAASPCVGRLLSMMGRWDLLPPVNQQATG